MLEERAGARVRERADTARAAERSAHQPHRTANLGTVGSHELTSWSAAVLRVRVEKACKVFRVCVNACPVDRALCTTARKSTELLFRTKNMFISFSGSIFFPQACFTAPSVMWIVVLQYT